MKRIERKKWEKRKRRIKRRLEKSRSAQSTGPILSQVNIQYELSDRVKGLSAGGIGAMHQLVQSIGLDEQIDSKLHVLKIHNPYHESDHVLSIAYNILAGGDCLDDIELLRNNEAYLNALGADRIPDPTTAGDFCRRFDEDSILTLLDVSDQARAEVWSRQPDEFFDQATIEMDGSIVPTYGECKEGVDVSFKGIWGYHPLILTLAETNEVLSLINRPGNRPSHEGAAEAANDAIQLCLESGFRTIRLRGDTDFTQTKHLDGWDEDGRIRFVFGMAVNPKASELADNLPESAWQPLRRRRKRSPEAPPRAKPSKHKAKIVKQRCFENIRLESEQVAQIRYRPVACDRDYRLVIVRKNLSVEKGELRLFDDIRYLMYLTNDWDSSMTSIVFQANDRCNQENIIEQLKNGTCSLKAPLDTLLSNWAYMVITTLAWNLKSWWAQLIPVTQGRWEQKQRDEKEKILRMEFKKFLNTFLLMPCQIIRTGRRVIYRLLSWNPWQPVFFRTFESLRL